MPRRREFGLFHISINGDLTLVMKGSIGEINRYAKDKRWTFRRDKSNLFGGYWVDDQTGDSYGADIIIGRKGQVKNPASDDPRTVLDFAWEIMELKKREGPSVKDKFTLAESGFGVAVTSARKIGARRVKYIDITAASGDKFQVTGYAGSDARLRLLGYPKAIQTSDANEAANYLSTIYAIRHAPGARR